MEKKATTTEGAGELTVKCASCETDQAVTHKCCSECGQPMAQANRAAYDTALQELGDFHKAQTGLDPKLAVAAGDHSTTETTIKAATAAGDDSQLVELLIGGQNRGIDHLVAIGSDLRAGRIDLGTFAGLMVKAMTAGFAAHEERVMERVDALVQRFDAWESTPGRSRSAAVTATLKALPGDELRSGQDDSPRGELLCKAAVGLVREGKLTTAEATLTQTYANQGLSLATLKDVAPALHARLSPAFAASGATH